MPALDQGPADDGCGPTRRVDRIGDRSQEMAVVPERTEADDLTAIERVDEIVDSTDTRCGRDVVQAGGRLRSDEHVVRRVVDVGDGFEAVLAERGHDRSGFGTGNRLDHERRTVEALPDERSVHEDRRTLVISGGPQAVQCALGPPTGGDHEGDTGGIDGGHGSAGGVVHREIGSPERPVQVGDDRLDSHPATLAGETDATTDCQHPLVGAD